MVLEFWWDDAYFGAARAYCACADAAEGAPALLAGLLTDDGGLDRVRSLARLDAGIALLRQVRGGHLAPCDWRRETLGAHIGPDGVRIGWLVHGEATETVALADAEQVFLAWRAFLAAGPAGQGAARVRVAIGAATAPAKF